jgi:hypothetical protein
LKKKIRTAEENLWNGHKIAVGLFGSRGGGGKGKYLKLAEEAGEEALKLARSYEEDKKRAGELISRKLKSINKKQQTAAKRASNTAKPVKKVPEGKAPLSIEEKRKWADGHQMTSRILALSEI